MVLAGVGGPGRRGQRPVPDKGPTGTVSHPGFVPAQRIGSGGCLSPRPSGGGLFPLEPAGPGDGGGQVVSCRLWVVRPLASRFSGGRGTLPARDSPPGAPGVCAPDRPLQPRLCTAVFTRLFPADRAGGVTRVRLLCAGTRDPRRKLAMFDMEKLPAVTPAPISVVLPVYNHEAPLEKGVEAWVVYLNGLVWGYEILLVDDGSTDRTPTLAEALTTRNPLVRLLRHETHRGFGAALRTGLAAAQHPLLVYCPGDLSYQP